MSFPRALTAALIAAVLVILILVQVIVRLQAEEERGLRVQLYTSRGLSCEQAELFIARFPTNDNETWIRFAIHWSRDPAMAEKALQRFSSVYKAVSYLDIAEKDRARELVVVDVRSLSPLDPRLLSLVTLQGLVNREAPRLYVVFKDVDAWWLARAAESFSLRIELAGIDDAVKRFALLAEGYVIYDPSLPDTINIGTTLCGAYNGVLVHPAWVSWLERLGVDKMLFDLRERFVDRVSAYQWAFEKLWDKVNKAKLAVACPGRHTDKRYNGNLQVACRDYAVALKLLTIYLDASNPAEKDLLERILSSMPYNSMVLGWYGDDEGAYVDLATRYRTFVAVMMHYASPLDFANPTFWMHLKPHENTIFPLPPIRPEVLGRGGIYITFYITDGDNLQWDYNMASHWQKRVGVPVAWTVSPFLLEVAPFVAYYYAKTIGGNDTFVCGPSGAGYIYPTSNKAYLSQYLSFTRYHLERSGLRIVEVLGYDDEVGALYAAQLAPWLLAVKRDYNELPGLFKAYGSSVYYVSNGNVTIPILFGALHFRSAELSTFASALDDVIEMYSKAQPEQLSFNPINDLLGFGDSIGDPASPTGKARFVKAGTRLGGALVFGPYVELPAGNYTVKFALKISAPTTARIAVLDVCTDIGATIIARRDVTGIEFVKVNEYQWFELNFKITQTTKNLEFRVWYDPGSGVDLYVGAVELAGIQQKSRHIPVVLVISQPWDIVEFEGLKRLLEKRPQLTPINLHELVALVNVEYGYQLALSMLESYEREGKLTSVEARELKLMLDEALSLYRRAKPYDAVARMIEFYRSLVAALKGRT